MTVVVVRRVDALAERRDGRRVPGVGGAGGSPGPLASRLREGQGRDLWRVQKLDVRPPRGHAERTGLGLRRSSQQSAGVRTRASRPPARRSHRRRLAGVDSKAHGTPCHRPAGSRVAGAMLARYILAVLAVVFLGAALGRVASGRPLSHPQTRTWLIVVVIFALVSLWLFQRT